MGSILDRKTSNFGWKCPKNAIFGHFGPKISSKMNIFEKKKKSIFFQKCSFLAIFWPFLTIFSKSFKTHILLENAFLFILNRFRAKKNYTGKYFQFRDFRFRIRFETFWIDLKKKSIFFSKMFIFDHFWSFLTIFDHFLKKKIKTDILTKNTF